MSWNSHPTLLIVVGFVAIVFIPGASAAPKSAPRATPEQEKAIKEFVAKVITAVGKQDVPGLVELSDVPFNYQRGGVQKEKEDLKRGFYKGIDGKPKFDGIHEVRAIETFAASKARFDEQEIKDAKEVLSDDDFVIHVEVQYPDRKLQARLLIKIKDGKPRLVGVGRERLD